MADITITGLDQVFANLNLLTDPSIIQKALMATAGELLELAEPKVPVDEGQLKDSKTVQKTETGALAGYNMKYAKYQHQGVAADGSRIIRNRPGGGESFFLTSTLEQNTSHLKDFARNNVATRLQKLIK